LAEAQTDSESDKSNRSKEMVRFISASSTALLQGGLTSTIIHRELGWLTIFTKCGAYNKKQNGPFELIVSSNEYVYQTSAYFPSLDQENVTCVFATSN
jgi:hypothetical protein